MDLLKRIITRRQTRSANQKSRFDLLMDKAAAGNLIDAEVAELDDLAAAAGMVPEQLEAELTRRCRIAELDNILADIPGIEREITDAGNQYTKLWADREKLVAPISKQIDDVSMKRDALVDRRARLQKFVDERKRLEPKAPPPAPAKLKTPEDQLEDLSRQEVETYNRQAEAQLAKRRATEGKPLGMLIPAGATGGATMADAIKASQNFVEIGDQMRNGDDAKPITIRQRG